LNFPHHSQSSGLIPTHVKTNAGVIAERPAIELAMYAPITGIITVNPIDANLFKK